MEMLLDINRNGTTVIVVTHDENHVTQMKKRVILLNDGEVVSDKERSEYIR